MILRRRKLQIPAVVVHVVLQLDTGGMERLLVEFARHANRSQFVLRFVSITGRGTVADELEALGWPVVAMNEPPGLRPGIVRRLAKLFKEWRADVVHVHNAKPMMYGGPAARFAGVPRVIYTRHGQHNTQSKRQAMVFNLLQKTADKIVCVSDDSAGLSIAEGLGESRVCRVWNGIDLKRFAFVGPQANGPMVMVGRLSPEKSVDTLLRAMALVVAKCPNAQLEIAGNGACKTELESLSRELKLEGNVKFLGEVRNVPALLSRASVSILPSLTEGISLTLLEAMAVGLPVVATRVGGNPEVVADGETGLLIPSADPAAMAEAIERMLASPAMRQEMGFAGRQRIEAHFDVSRMVGNYEGIYLEKDGSAGGKSTAATRQVYGASV